MKSEHFDHIRQVLMPPGVGIWYQELREKRGSNPKWRRIGKPAIDAEYCRLFGLASPDDFPGARLSLVSPAHRPDVTKTLINSINDPTGEAHECTFKIILPRAKHRDSDTGQSRWIYARVQRIQIENRTYLAAWNSDVTFLKEKEQFLDAVLATIPGFVFLKQFIEPGKRTGPGKFSFTYCNALLKEELDQAPPQESSVESYYGKTDYDYFPKEQADEFTKRDLEAFNARGCQITVAEEKFGIQGKTQIRTLTTVKTRFDTVGTAGDVMQCVLGVAVDVSGFMGLLEAAMNASNEGLYVQNQDREFIYVNKAFRDSIGATHTTQLHGRSFTSVLGELHGQSGQPQIGRLISEIEAAESKLTSQEGTQIELPIWLNETKFILTLNRVAEDKGQHIIGAMRVHFDAQRINAQIVKNSPHFICIKDNQLKILHCNWPFAERRGLSIEECFGKSDLDFWPEERFPGQARRFQKKDIEVLDLLPLLEDLERNPDRSEKEKRAIRKSILKKYTAYEETLEIEEIRCGIPIKKTLHLLTTKWPDRINGAPVIHVSYSDVTETKEQMEKWHRYTVHAIRNELPPLDSSFLELKSLLARVGSSPVLMVESRQLSQLYLNLFAARSGIQFYMDNHLKFVTGKCSLVPGVSLAAIVDERVSDWRYMKIDYAKFEDPLIEPETREVTVKGDEVFLKAAVTEMIRNSLKAVERRFSPLFGSNRAASSFARGVISVKCRLRQKADKITKPCIVISVLDNGDACLPGSQARSELKHGIEKAKDLSAAPTGHFGLRFLYSVAAGHGGVYSYKITDHAGIESHLVIPIERPEL